MTLEELTANIWEALTAGRKLLEADGSAAE